MKILFSQEAPRDMASIREQTKGRSDKQRFGEDALHKQGKREVKKTSVLPGENRQHLYHVSFPKSPSPVKCVLEILKVFLNVYIPSLFPYF